MTKKADKKTRKITIDQARLRLSSSVCPSCGEYIISKRMAFRTVGEGRDKETRFGGSYWSCAGPRAHECYYMSLDGLRETTTAPPLDQAHVSNLVTVKRRKK